MAASTHFEHAVQAIWFLLPWLFVGGAIAMFLMLRELRQNAKINKEHRRGRRKRMVHWL